MVLGCGQYWASLIFVGNGAGFGSIEWRQLCLVGGGLVVCVQLVAGSVLGYRQRRSGQNCVKVAPWAINGHRFKCVWRDNPWCSIGHSFYPRVQRRRKPNAGFLRLAAWGWAALVIRGCQLCTSAGDQRGNGGRRECHSHGVEVD